ncbi:MAG: trypsin-like peptidase domain-containing protein [Chthoniobacterales bacterium]|nr:trypsin-like peptidase domain-containing protein [Chthoniobacterales bacterium]
MPLPRFLALFAVAAGLALPASAVAEPSQSMVRISTTSQQPDYTSPWNPPTVSDGVGAGFIIEGKRIMTNAHVVSNATFVTVLKEGDPTLWPARVVHIAHDCDLALLEVDDPAFFENTKPLDFGGIPALESEVSVYGYPIGGDRLSVTRGIVSRVDFQLYTHSSIDSHLTIQIDAAINPGNSGGPVMQAGKVVGVAFQGYSGDVAQSVGYMIPAPVIKRFLQDVKDGSYDRYMDLAATYFPLLNPAQRSALGMTSPDNGVLVASVFEEDTTGLRPGDVILSVDGRKVYADGKVDIDGERVQVAEVFERKFKGDKSLLEIMRGGKEEKVTLELTRPWPFDMQARSYAARPRFILVGGLLFQPLNRNFFETRKNPSVRLRYFFQRYVTDHLFHDYPEVVVLSEVLQDPFNTYILPFKDSIVAKINGRQIRGLEDVAAAFEEPGDFHVIELLGEGRPVVLERAALAAAESRIKERYRITTDKNL